MNINDLRHKAEQLRTLVKYGISGIAFIATLHCGMLCFGYDVLYVHLFFCIFAMALGIALSRMFDMCFVHKASVIYIVAVLSCIVLRRHNVFRNADVLHYSRGIMFVIGIIISFCNLWKMTRNGRN